MRLLWQRCLDLEPGFFWARYWVAVSSFRLGDREVAVGALQVLLSEEKEVEVVLSSLTEFYLEMHRYEEAVVLFTKLQDMRGAFFGEYRLAVWIIRDYLLPSQSVPDPFSLPKEFRRYTFISSAESASRLL